MTQKPGRKKFAWMEALRGAEELTHAEYRVLVNLSTHASGDLTKIYGSVAQVVREACVSEPTAKKAIKSLIEKGWLVLVDQGGNQYWRGKANEYALAIPKGVTHLPPSGDRKGVNRGPEGGNSVSEGGKPFSEKGVSELPPISALLPPPLTTSSTPISSPHLSNAGAHEGEERDLIGPEDVAEGSTRQAIELIPGGVTFAEFQLIEDGAKAGAEPGLIARKILARRPRTPGRLDTDTEAAEPTPMEWLETAVHGLSADERQYAEDMFEIGQSRFATAQEIRENRKRRKAAS